jgi:hypothetical protein
MTRRISSRFFASFIHFGNVYASCRLREGTELPVALRLSDVVGDVGEMPFVPGPQPFLVALRFLARAAHRTADGQRCTTQMKGDPLSPEVAV